MADFSLETTPGSAAKIPDFREHVRPGTTVYITFLPGSDFADTIAVARRLRDEGFNPVPHFAARSIASRDVFESNLKRVVEEAGVRQVLLIGGAIPYPLGEFSDSMQLLSTGLFDKYGIRKIGVAGHPEGSPDIPEEAVKQAVGKYCTCLTLRITSAVPVSQFSKDPVGQTTRMAADPGTECRMEVQMEQPG